MLVFISGPINGIPNGNREAFVLRADELRIQGHEPLSPWDVPAYHTGPCLGRAVDHGSPHRYGCLFRKGLIALMSCDAVTFLDGWQISQGATIEHSVAEAIGMPVL